MAPDGHHPDLASLAEHPDEPAFEVDVRDGDTGWTNVVAYSPIGSRSGSESIATASTFGCQFVTGMPE